MSPEEKLLELPVLPLKNTVLFPYIVMPLSVGRPFSVAAVEDALSREEKEILVVAQRDPSADSPPWDQLYGVGTKAVIKKMLRAEDGSLKLIIQGVERVDLVRQVSSKPFLRAAARLLPLPAERSPEVEALHREVIDLLGKALALARSDIPLDFGQLFGAEADPMRTAYVAGSIFSLDVAKEQALLEASTVAEALRLLHTYLTHEVKVLELRGEIASQAQVEMGKEQREYILRKQLRAIQQELGEKSPEQAEVELLRERLSKADLPESAAKEAANQLSRLDKLPPASPEYHVIRTYLELIIELPWKKASADLLDLGRARQVLDEDHYDLKEVKQRILEHLAVLKLNPRAKAPILCFTGPPGVGKTSLGQSIARALDRKFERMSLGGLHDEAELRGHRRTYVGAMPGRILQAIRRAGVNNPVLMLDEVDKLGRDFRGDPAAALLEILDPEQNRDFRDNYLDLPFDLSRALFITTANALETIPRPLLDRMEVLRLPGYSEEEKIEIARRYLIPRQLRETGLDAERWSITGEALSKVISRYTREAGVRQLERKIGSLARKTALGFAEGKTEKVTVRPEDLAELLGPEMFFLDEAREELPAGVAAGLAWTESGGEVLYVEAALLPGGTGLTLTGQLGEVMQESVKAAQSYIWSHAEALGIDAKQFRKAGLHVHVPAGAIPKDGPSAGITVAAALASLYSGQPIRKDTAMTGEITLTGLVLPVGGIKEKVLAARRAGIHRVILSQENRKDLRDLPEYAGKELEFIFIERIEEALEAAIAARDESLAVSRAG